MPRCIIFQPNPCVIRTDIPALRAFTFQNDMQSSYHFATLSSQLLVKSGDASAADLACISVKITPDLGASLRNTLAYVPLVILVLVGLATIVAAIYSPWGTTDLFRWTSNYGRDEDVLRLVTPGFGDCLQYIQFAVLTGGLSLNYPGYYQPVVSQPAWAALMFNQSFVNPGKERNPVIDGVYAVNATYGLDRLEHYVGMSSAQDIWPGMMVWLLVVVVSITLLIQLAFVLRWLRHQIANISEEDLRAKNMPFTVGNVVRIVFNFLFLPVISLSFFQLVIAGDSPAYCVVFAVVVIIILIAFSIWTIRLIVATRPKSYLFDDLSTVLLYGPLYNTFNDDAAAYAVVPIFISFARGVAIGALQPSGIAQVVLLAICEVVSVLTLVAFRPFPSPTSMNLYHICFSIVRFLTILLSVVFVPSLGVSEAARGWIGYVILLLHALVLVFGFFLNALQTLIEVIARLAGAGGNEGNITRGGLAKVFGMRQLSRREPRQDLGTRQSMGSEAGMLTPIDGRLSSQLDGSRARSMSGSSALLLGRAGASDGRASAMLESGSAQGGASSRANSSGLQSPITPKANAAFPPVGSTAGSSMSRGSPLFGMQSHDPYYRPPRPRKKTLDTDVSGAATGPAPRTTHFTEATEDMIDSPSSNRGAPVPAYLSGPKDDLDLDDPRPARKDKDYAVREVDFYYRVRGPPLSHTGTRKLKTGPADPTGPVSSATGWFRNMFRGKTKEKGKGFEVVRSARAPPQGLFVEGEEFHEPYRDEPDESGAANPTRQTPDHDPPYRDSDGEDPNRSNNNNEQTGTGAPSLPPVDSGGGIELPSRMGSQHSSHPPSVTISRQHSTRQPSMSSTGPLDAVAEDESQDPNLQLQPTVGMGRFPFSATSSPSRDRDFSVASTAQSTTSSGIGRGDSGRSRVERPSSMGYVTSHRTQDNIHEASVDRLSLSGSAAEWVDEGVSDHEHEHGHGHGHEQGHGHSIDTER